MKADLSTVVGITASLLPLLLGTTPVQSFLSPSHNHLSKTPCMLPQHPSHNQVSTELSMAKSKTKKKKKISSSGGGLKGFGSPSSSASSKSGAGGTIDRSPSALKFYEYLQRNGGGSNLKRVGK